MTDEKWVASYLGGHPSYPAREPVRGQLTVSSEVLDFQLLGDFFETLFAVPWESVSVWAVDGPSTPDHRSSGGRAAVGALLAAAAGAVVGLASVKARYSAALALTFDGHPVAFLIDDRAPAAVAAALRRVPRMAALADEATSSVQAWSYETATLDELETLGKDGWEAVGVWTDESGVRVLLKHPLN